MGDNSEILNYTIVLHQARKTLGITLTQYCIADCVYHLTNNPKSQIPGWCYASKEHIGNFLGITPQSVWDRLKPLIDKGIIEKNPDDRRFLKTTELWYNTVILKKLRLRGQSRKILDYQGKPDNQSRISLHSNQGKPLIQSRKTLHYNNKISIINNNKDKKNKNYTPQDIKLVEILYKLVKENYSFVVDRKTEKAKIKDYEELNRLNRIDGRDYQLIEFVIRFSQQDKFWKMNIRSVFKLRKQFDTLMVHAKSEIEQKQIIDFDK